MRSDKLLCIAAAIVLSCCAAVGCADSSSKKADSSASSSVSDSSSKTQSSSASDSSEKPKPNAIGYDAKTSKRLYDEMKEIYAKDGYELVMKSNANINSEMRLCIKDSKVYSYSKSPYSDQTMIFNGGSNCSVYDHTSKTYTEKKVDDAKTFVTKNDLVFGMTGDFIEAKVDEKNNVINEYYKIKSDVSGSEGTICFCFSGENGRFVQITLQYQGSEMPILFGITEMKKCDEKVFDSKDNFNYKKQQ